MVSQVGGALRVAHEHGVIHRSVRPANIVLDEDGNAYLTNFGIAQSLISSGDLSALLVASESPAYVSPEERSGDPVTRATDIFALGTLVHHLMTGRVPSDLTPPEFDEFVPPAVSNVIQTATSPDPMHRFSDARVMATALRRAVGTVSEDEPVYTRSRNPYKGLAAFAEADAADFHGRDEVVAEILGMIGASRLVAVVGPSGIGKSSVVRAGVVPRLRSGALDGSAGWFITTMVPGAYPFEELATALMRVATESVVELDEKLERDRTGMTRAVERLLPAGADLLLIIDQFEELFTLADPAARDAFLDGLTTLVTDERSGVRVVLTLRADYFDRPLRHAELGAILRTATVPVGVPTVDELHEIIEDPASAVGVGFEAGVPDRIVAAVEGRPGVLPLVEFALTDLFEGRESDLITASDFVGAGGVLGALGSRADATFAALDRGGQIAARQVFMRLMAFGGSPRPAGRRARRAELYGLPVPRGDLEAMLSSFGAARLLTFDRDAVTRGQTVEVAHEALFTEWVRLAGWVEEQREDLLLARRLAVATDEWESADRGEAYLLSGGRLAQHEVWTADTEIGVTNAERELLVASRFQEDDRRRRSRRRRVGVLSGFAVATVLALVLAAVAAVARNNAEQQARTAAARGLASAAAASTTEDPERSLLLALAAADTTRQEGEPVLREAEEEVHRSLNEHRVLSRYGLGGGVAVSPDGALIAVGGIGGDGRGIEILDGTSGELITAIAQSEDAMFSRDITFSFDGRFVATVSASSELTVWDALTGRELARMSNEAGGWPHFNPDGSRILVVNSSPSATLWDWEAGEEIHRFELAGGAWGGDISPDGKLVAIGERDAGAVAVFDATSGDRLRRIEGHTGLLSDVAFSPDGTRLASSSDVPSRIVVSDVATGDSLLTMPSPTESVATLAWSPDGDELAFGGFSGELAIIDAATGEERLRLSGIDGVIHSAAWFRDGERIAVAGTPVETVVWDVRERNVGDGLPADSSSQDFGFTGAWYTGDDSVIVLPRLHTGLSLFDLATTSETASRTPGGAWVDWPGLPIVSADGTLVAMSDAAGLMTIYDTQSLAMIRSFEAGVPIDVFSPTGESIVVAPRVGSDPVPADVRPGLVDIATGEFMFTFDELGSRLWNDVLALEAAFHPSGDFVAVSGPTRVYDTRSGEVVFAPEPWGNALAFSPDGSRFAILTEAGFAHLYDFDAGLAGATPKEAQIRAWQALDATGLVVRWTVDGSRLLAGGMDDRLLVFDGEGQETLLQIPTGPVATIDFSKDGRSALVSGLDGPRIVPLDTDDLLNMARARLTRGFTPAECEQFFPDEDCPTLEELRAG